MSELTHDTAEDGFHEIQLSGKQLVFLFIVGTSVVIGVFLLGVLVGRGARAVRGEEPDIVAESTQSPAPAAAVEGGPPAAEPPAPAAESADELSYHKRLQGSSTPAEVLKTPKPEAKPAAPPPSAPPAAAPPAQRGPAPVSSDVPTTGRPGTIAVQVIASQDRAVAVALVMKLNRKGYPAFLVMPASNNVPQIYKVQVGRYTDRREADQIKQRLEKEEQFKPWISSR